VTHIQFADNTALVNFALIGRVDVLARLMNGRGAWTATVRLECEQSALALQNDQLLSVGDFLGEPYYPESSDEIEAIGVAREFLREPGDGPERHLGEAETIAIVTMRSLAAIVVTDDTGAMKLARRHGVPVATSSDLMILAVRANVVSPQQAWDYITELRVDHRRHLPRAPETFADLLVLTGRL